MVVLDSFPFQEDFGGQYLGGTRLSTHTFAGNDPQTIGSTCLVGSMANGDVYSLNTSHGSREPVQLIENTSEYITLSKNSQGHSKEIENSPGYLKCRLCHYQTKIESLLKRHVLKHSLDANFRCPACNFEEGDPNKFADHICTHQGGKLVRCCFCPKKMLRSKLKDHIRIHRAVELYDCSMCQFSTNYEKTIKSHMEVFHTKEYPCRQCGLTLTKHDLHWHMKLVHSMETYLNLVDQSVISAVPARPIMNANISNCSSKILKQSIFPREICTYKTSRKTPIIGLKIKKLISSKKPFNCGKCDYKTPFKKLLRAHRAKHLLDNSLVCTKCGFKEVGPGKFSSHLALHSPKDLFECCFCGFLTPTRGTMSNHVTKHKPLPMFDCSECEFAARRPVSVRIHYANVHGKKSRCPNCCVEMSRLAMANHRKKCLARDNPDSDDGISYQNPKTEQYECNTYSDSANGNVLNENVAVCEFCKKPYAKSYIRKHAKRCLVGNESDAESKECRELNAVSPELQPLKNTLTIGIDAPVLLNSDTASTHQMSIEPYHDSLLTSTFPERSNFQRRKPLLQCNCCIFKTRKKYLLKRHVVKHLVDFRLTCPTCGHKEMSSFKFAHHLMEHGGDPGTFQCCFCSLSAPTTKRSYCAHLDRHRPVNIFDCPKCEYSSNRADNVRNHFKNNHSKNHKCQYCGETMSKVRHLKHVLECRGEENDANFKLCNADTKLDKPNYSHSRNINAEARSATEGPDKQHYHDNHNSADIEQTVPINLKATGNESLPFKTDQELLKCTKCSFHTKIQSLMDRHTAKHLIDLPFVCPLCDFEHTNSRKFANHWDKHECHAKKKIYQCCFCDAIVKKKNCLKGFLPQHIEGHRNVSLHDCSECEFSSHSRYELDKHYRNQHVKKCECSRCGEVMTIFEHSRHTECKSDNVEDVREPAEKPHNNNRIDNREVDFSTLRRHSADVQESLIAALDDPAFLHDSEPCTKKLSKEELNSHERKCSRSFKNEISSHLQSSSTSQMEKSNLSQTFDDLPHQAVQQRYERVPAYLTHDSNLSNEQVSSATHLGFDDANAMKGLLPHPSNLTPYNFDADIHYHTDYTNKQEAGSHVTGMKSALSQATKRDVAAAK